MLGVIGDLVEDVIVWLREPLRYGTDTEAAVYRQRGGSAANVAAFAALHHPTRFIGCVGKDRAGESLVAEMSASGVDVRVQRHGVTGAIVILIDQSGERSMLPSRAAAVQLTEVPDAWLSDLRLLHVPGYCFALPPLRETAIEVIKRFKDRGGEVSIDASSTGMINHFGVGAFMDLLAELRPDFLFANEGESELLELATADAWGPGLARLPHTIVLAKAGAEPTRVHWPNGDSLVVPVNPVSVVRDLTGAGDAFAAGFLTAHLSGSDIATAVLAGHRLAGRVLSSPGASLGDVG